MKYTDDMDSLDRLEAELEEEERAAGRTPEAKAWRDLGRHATKRYGLTRDEYKRVVPLYGDVNSPRGVAVRTGDTSGLKRESTSPGALLPRALAFGGVVSAVPTTLGAGLLLANKGKSIAGAGLTGLGLLAGMAATSHDYKLGKSLANEYNSILDKIEANKGK